jgi:uncharacterized protein YrzB (UPF0473 family)
MSEEEEIVVLQDEDGKDVRFQHIMTFDFEESFYVALTPEKDMDGIQNGDVILLEIVEDEDGSDCYVPLEDEARLNKVWEEFERLYYEDDEEGGCDCDECSGCGHDHGGEQE